jgi:low affinity Fe/Cu permease
VRLAAVNADRRGRGDVRTVGTGLLHLIGRASAVAAVAWTLLGLDLLWVVYSIVVGFPARPEAIFQTTVSAVTLAIVFVIQHTQSREQVVTQRKLDEILRALPHADNTLIGLEEGTDVELSAVRADQRELRAEAIRATDDNTTPPAE